MLVVCASAYTQKPFFKNFSVANGLPSSNVYYITQDTKGYIWIATDAGVSRFDGIEFKTYTTQDGLSDNEVLQIHQDSFGRLWFMTLNGRLSFYKNDEFIDENYFKGAKKTNTSSFSYSLSEDKKGNVYTVINRGPVIKITSNDSIEYLHINDNLKYYTWITGDEVYVLSVSGIYKIDKSFSSYKLLIPFNLNKHALRACTYNNNIIFAYGTGIYEYHIKKNELKLLSAINHTYITSLTTLNKEIWVGTKDGVLKFADREALKNSKYQRYLSGLTVTSILQDREKNLWFTTLEKGVFFTPSIHITNYNNLIEKNKVTSLYKDVNNKLWIGSIKNSYATYDSGYIRNYKLQQNGREDDIVNIRGSGKNNIWIVSKTSTLNITNDANGKVLRHRYLPYWANDIFVDSEENFWLGSSACWLLPLQSVNNKLSSTINPSIINYNSNSKKILPYTVNCFERGANHNLYIGCKNGLYSIDIKTKELSSWREKFADLGGEITALKLLNEDLLVGTSINGLLILDSNKNIKKIPAFNKLSSNRITTIHIENDSTLWIGTYRGLDKLIVRDTTYLVSNFTQEVGIGSITVNDIEIIDEHVFIGSNEGLIRVNKNIENKQAPPLIYISEVSVDGQIVSTDNLNIKHSYNSMFIKVNAISFRDIEAIKYYYKIEEHDKGWLPTYSTYINFASLRSGNYTVCVKAINSLGIESDVKRIQFSVLQPFWKTWWFYTLILASLSSIVYAVFHIKTKFVKRKFELERNNFRMEKERLELEKNLVELEQKTSRLQMNPHFIFNALNTIKSYYVDNKSDLGNRYTNKFAKLLRLILEAEESFTTLDVEIEIIQLYLELTQIRYQDKFSFEINIQHLIPEDTLVPSMLLQPFVENSVIHGLAPRKGRGHIAINFEVRGDMLYCIIDDNGIGRKAAGQISKNAEHVSKATELVNSRLEMLSRNSKAKAHMIIEDKMADNIATGTKVTIIIPYKNV